MSSVLRAFNNCDFFTLEPFNPPPSEMLLRERPQDRPAFSEGLGGEEGILSLENIL